MRLKLILILIAVLMILQEIAMANGVSNITYAKDVLARIDPVSGNLPVNYTDCIIEGDLDLSQTNLTINKNTGGYIIPVMLRFYNCTIEKDVIFNNAVFIEGVDFERTTFQGKAYFDSSQFDRYSNFRCCDFAKDTSFRESLFLEDAHFEGSLFNGTANFWGSEFFKDAYFSGSSFNSTANFGRSKFQNAYFDGSVFNGDADFSESQFQGHTAFEGSQFLRTAYFSDSFFKGGTSFNRSRFGSVLNFINSTFYGDVYFLYTQGNDISFEDVKSTKEIDLTNCNFGNFYCDWDFAKNHLNLTSATKRGLRIKYQEAGLYPDADDVLYQMRTTNQAKIHDHFIWFWDYLAMISFGYGVKPQHPFGFSIFFIFLFGLLWSTAPRRTEAVDDEYSFPRSKRSIKYPMKETLNVASRFMEPFAFSATVFLSGTKLFVDAPEIPELPILSKSSTRKLFISERILGGIFSVLFFIALGATVIRGGS